MRSTLPSRQAADRPLIGRVDAEAVKRDPKMENQHELFFPLSEQWEQWIDRLCFQPARQATVASQDGRVVSLRTTNISATKVVSG